MRSLCYAFRRLFGGARMQVEVPDFLIEMSVQMNKQPNRCTAHPFWQVRCKRYAVTEKGYSEHHFEYIDDEGSFFRSDKDGFMDAVDYLKRNYASWYEGEASEGFEDYESEDLSLDCYVAGELQSGEIDLPEGCVKVFMQEIEEVVSTHLTEADAEWFIQRKQHDYPPLYTYVESAYWSPQLRQLQDWIISLSEGKECKQ